MQGKLFFSALVAIVLMASCKGMYDSLDEYSGEVVYPAKYDTIVGRIGYERVEINLMKAGRIPSSRINLGKAKKTVVEYDGKVITIDSLVSWVNITGLDQPKLYRFRIYTTDEFENKSVPQEIALIPFTEGDIANLAINSPRILASGTSAVVDWPNGLSSVLLNYTSMTFKYTDNSGAEQTGERKENPRFFMSNLQAGSPNPLQINYRVVPRVNNVAILDTVTLVRNLSITGSETFSPAERTVLETNGVTAFTATAVSSVTKLTYPLHANSLQDLFYFTNLKELDLTGGTLFQMRTLSYDRNSARSTIGGGDFPSFVAKVGNNTIGSDYLTTGIGIQKLVHPESQSNAWQRVARYPYPIVRMSDLYLMKAEALNEYNSAPTAEVYELVNRIRTRAGLPDVQTVYADVTLARTPNKHLTREGMRDIILDERSVEFAFEGRYFWDMWRHKRATTAFSSPVWGWTHTGANGASFFVLEVKQARRFTITDYLWPIDLNELNTNGNLIQNPGW